MAWYEVLIKPFFIPKVTFTLKIKLNHGISELWHGSTVWELNTYHIQSHSPSGSMASHHMFPKSERQILYGAEESDRGVVVWWLSRDSCQWHHWLSPLRSLCVIFWLTLMWPISKKLWFLTQSTTWLCLTQESTGTHWARAAIDQPVMEHTHTHSMLAHSFTHSLSRCMCVC